MTTDDVTNKKQLVNDVPLVLISLRVKCVLFPFDLFSLSSFFFLCVIVTFYGPVD